MPPQKTGIQCLANKALVEHLRDEEIKYREMQNDRMVLTLQKAIRSIMNHPGSIRSKEEAMKVKGVGDYLGSKIEAILRKLNLLNVVPLASEMVAEEVQRPIRKADICNYNPQQGGPAYLILLGTIKCCGEASSITTDQAAILKEVEIISPQTNAQDPKYSKAIQMLCKRGVLWQKKNTVGFTPKGFQLAALCFQESRLQYPVVNMCMEHQILSRLEALFPYSSKSPSSISLPVSPSRNGNPPPDRSPEVGGVDGGNRKRPHTAVDLSLSPEIGMMNSVNIAMAGQNGILSPNHQPTSSAGTTLYLPRLTWPLAPPSKHQHFGEMSTILEDEENGEHKENGEEELAGNRGGGGGWNCTQESTTNRDCSEISNPYRRAIQTNDPTVFISSTTTTNLHTMSSYSRNMMEIEDRVLEGREEEWEVLLLLDSREVRTQQDRSFLHNQLQLAGVSCDVRSLGLGDMQWIARRGGTGQEVMLSTIVERKNTRDFAQSILDGRFDEQQYRLMNCGCKHPIYLIEGSLRSQDVLSPDKLQSDIMTTVVHRNLYVYMSTSIDDTVVFLKGVHERVKDSVHQYFVRWDEECLHPDHLSFADFQTKFCKSREVDLLHLWCKQLRQIPRCSAAKVEIITSVYPTLQSLLNAYDQLYSRGEKEGLLKHLSDRKGKNTIGLALSRTIFHCLCG